MTVQPGAQASVQHSVADDDTALALGSGDLEVLATPRLLAWCEQATVSSLIGRIDDASSTVGTRVELTHLRASPVGAAITVRADLVHVDTDDIAFTPVGDITDLVTHLVWSVGSRHVRDTWVAGRQVVRDGVSTTVDEAELRAQVQQRGMRLARDAG